jgi:hypothetical protein
MFLYVQFNIELAVGMSTVYGLDGWDSRQDIVLYSTPSNQLWGPLSLLSNRYREGLLPKFRAAIS